LSADQALETISPDGQSMSCTDEENIQAQYLDSSNQENMHRNISPLK
jgi:hypothetical protein